jgi:translocation and assembly module TamB
MAAWQNDSGRNGNGAPGGAAVRRRRLRNALIGIVVVVVIALASLWSARRPIASNVLANEMEKRGVQATYQLDRVGLRTQEISNIVIGDPARPDLTARYAQVQMRIRWNGSIQVYRIYARGVRLRGRLIPGRVSWGQVDKLLPPPSGKPFRFPDVTVDLADTTVALTSGYGVLGVAVEGAGNLTGGFKGRLAAASPRLVPGRCQLVAMRASLALEIKARKPHAVGPLDAARFDCPQSRIALVAPRMELDTWFSEAFASFEGKGRMAVQSLTAGDNGLAALNGNLTFVGNPEAARGDVNLAAQRARLGNIYADRTRLKGKYLLGAATGVVALVADYEANSAALDPSVTAGLTNPLQAAGSTPLGPIATAIANAITRTSRGFDASGTMRLVNSTAGGAARIETADARGPNGARVRVSGGDGVTYYWPSGRMRVDGLIEMQGGGLPMARVRIDQPRGGGPMSGEARIAPYTAGGARLALAPVIFRAANDGTTNVRTVALLDGPFPGGRVRGLRIPIDGRFGGPGGGFAFGRGCIEARFQLLQAGSLRLGAARIPLCATGPAIVYQRGDGSMIVGATTRNLRLAGRLGDSPFRLTAAQARLNGSDRFAANRLAIQFGRPDAPVKFDAANLAGRFIKGGAAGDFSGAEAIIGRVPLLLSDANGKWNFRNGALDVDGGLTLAHRADPPSFYPLRSDDVHVRLADDMIRATGTLKHPASGTPVSNVTIGHRLSTGAGDAVFDVPGIRFGEGLQPEELTRLTEGVIALVQGTLLGQGRIAWSGSGAVTSSGSFSTANMDFAAPFGPVTGMSGTIHFDDLLGLTTPPGQVMAVKSINPGILVENGVIRFQLLPDQLVKVERGEWPFMGGTLILQETVLNFGRPSPKRLTFEVVGLDAKTFVQSLGFKEIDATGTFDGVLPMIFDEEGGRIVGGRLDSRPPGGSLAYNGVVNKANLGMMGNIAFDALRDLRFNSMIVRLDGDLAGEFATRLTIDGVALGQTGTQKIIRNLLRKLPLKMNVTIIGPFRALIATAKAFRDPRAIIADVLPRPLDEVPGIVTEVRRREEEQQQTQTPIEQKIETTPQPPAPSE